MTAKTPTERQRAYLARGWPITVVLTDKRAIATLKRLIAKHGGPKAAITAALQGELK